MQITGLLFIAIGVFLVYLVVTGKAITFFDLLKKSLKQ
jgi:hypothetical protein